MPTLGTQALAWAWAAALWGLAPAAAGPLEIRVSDQHGRPLPGAVVYLESAAARAATRSTAGLEIEQRDRQFHPEVLVVTVGTEVRFPNRDKVRHHVYSISPAKTFDLKLFLGNDANPVLFDRAGVAVLGCNIHDEMVAWVVVVETPYHGRSGPGGQLRLEAPAGSYRLLAWHPDLPVGAPAVAQSLNLPAGGAAASVSLPVTAAP